MPSIVLTQLVECIAPAFTLQLNTVHSETMLLSSMCNICNMHIIGQICVGTARCLSVCEVELCTLAKYV
jgi:hypothetical protein